MSLSVTVNSASNLPNVDVLDDVSDPYTRITLKGESIICTQSIKYYKQNVILHIILVSLSHVIVVMIRMYWKYKLMNLGKHLASEKVHTFDAGIYTHKVRECCMKLLSHNISI